MSTYFVAYFLMASVVILTIVHVFQKRYRDRRDAKLMDLMVRALQGDENALTAMNARRWLGSKYEQHPQRIRSYLSAEAYLPELISRWKEAMTREDVRQLLELAARLLEKLSEYWYLPAGKTQLIPPAGATSEEVRQDTQDRLDEVVAAMVTGVEDRTVPIELLMSARELLGKTSWGFKFPTIPHWNQLIATHLVSPFYRDFDWPEQFGIGAHPHLMAAMAVRLEDVTVAKMLLAYHHRGHCERGKIGHVLAADLARMVAEKTASITALSDLDLA